MQHLLVSASLLVLAASQDLEAKKHYSSDADPKSWPLRGGRNPWDEPYSEFIDTTMVKYGNRRPALDAVLLRDARQIVPVALVCYTSEEAHVKTDDSKELRKLEEYLDKRVQLKEKESIVSRPVDDQNTGNTLPENCKGPLLQRGSRQGHRWRIQEPLYVEEPNWIEIERNDERSDQEFDASDVFFVARGKKLLKLEDTKFPSDPVLGIKKRYLGIKRSGDVKLEKSHSEPLFRAKRDLSSDTSKDPLKEVGRSSNTNNSKEFVEDVAKNNFRSELKTADHPRKTINGLAMAKTTGKRGRIRKIYPEFLTRRKRSSCNEKLEYTQDSQNSEEVALRNYFEKKEKMNGDLGKTLNELQAEGKIPNIKHVEQRDKHSNVLDILKEPFVISRGKKGRRPRFFEEELLAASEISSRRPLRGKCFVPSVLENGTLGDILSIVKRHGANSEKCSKSSQVDPESRVRGDIWSDWENDKPPRDRRGSLDELLRRYDPFYTARGKRFSTSISKKYGHLKAPLSEDSFGRTESETPKN